MYLGLFATTNKQTYIYHERLKFFISLRIIMCIYVCIVMLRNEKETSLSRIYTFPSYSADSHGVKTSNNEATSSFYSLDISETEKKKRENFQWTKTTMKHTHTVYRSVLQ